MSLYDSIKFDKPPIPRKLHGLKKSDFVGALYQTHDLDDTMSTFKVEKGVLYVERIEGEWIETDGTGWDRLKFNVKSREWVKHGHTGIVRAYSYFVRNDLENDFDIEYEVNFERGRLKSIKIYEFKIAPNSERKEREAGWKRDSEERKERAGRIHYKYFLVPLSRSFGWACKKVLNFIDKVRSAVVKMSIWTRI